MRPALQMVTEKLRAADDWPTVQQYVALLIRAGASKEEALSFAPAYQLALAHGWRAAGWQAAETAPSAEDELMASLRAFSRNFTER